MSKLKTVEEVLPLIRSGSTLMVGGFGLVGAPLTLIKGLEEHDVRDLTIISNNIGEPGKGLGKLLRDGKIKKAIGSYFTSNPEVGELYNQGRLEVELVPQGTLAERIRAGGAGLGGFYTRTSVGTLLEKGKEKRELNGAVYVLEYPLKADVALIRAHKADELGNLVYYKTARNFNPIMAGAADLVIAEVDEIVPAGSLDPESVVTPHLYVDHIVKATVRIEEVLNNG
jgi:3-oxoacid CoA-transferase subunit A